MVASRRLDALITILEWIFSEYVVVLISNFYNSSDSRRLCMARYDEFPYEGLLAQAYNLRLYQSGTHLTNDECILSSVRYYPCVNHHFRSKIAQDRVFDAHFYVSLASPVSHVPNYFDLPYAEMPVVPLNSSEYQSLVHNAEQFYQQLLQSVHVTIHQAVLTPDPIHLNANMLSFSTLMGKLFWIKNQDHVRERLWQQLLSYLSNHYYVMVYYQRLTADQVSLYVPSAAVRDNDSRCNPLGHRRVTTIRGLAQTPAVQVPASEPTGPIITPSFPASEPTGPIITPSFFLVLLPRPLSQSLII